MNSKFCFLEKDYKTFNILKKYVEDINNHVDLFCEDQKIQAEEIIEHQKRTGQNGIEWSDRYARGERLYLNAVKELSILFICTQTEITWDNFCFFIDKLNLIKNCILDKID